MKKSVFLGGVAWLALVANLSAEEAVTTPILTGANNFRDLAGIAASINGISTGGTGEVNTVADDGTMRTGVFYRSNALNNLTPADKATLTTLGITTDYDLRTPTEIATAPDALPSGIAYVNINIIGTSSVSTSGLTSAANAEAFMELMNQNFVTSSYERSQIAALLLDLAGGNGAALYHCTAGKDRTGWVSAVLESIAGVSQTQIMTDYLATNAYSAASIAATVAALPASYQPIYAKLLGVEAQYLQAGLDQVTTSYGSMQNYLINGLGLSLADIYVLRAKMVYYDSLPGMAAMSGNSAAGANLLVGLQNTPLSGAYTSFNYYLQSSIDAGSLGRVPAEIGGQVYADTSAYLFSEPRIVADTVASQASVSSLTPGQSRVWALALDSYLHSPGSSGNAQSSSNSGGPLFGISSRLNEQFALFGGAGYNWAAIKSAGASATLDGAVLTVGGRYGFEKLGQGVFVGAEGTFGSADVKTTRALDGNLGTASGKRSGDVAAVEAELGYDYQLNTVTLTPRTGIRLTRLDLNSETESGSQLALSVQGEHAARTSAYVALDAQMSAIDLGNSWKVTPTATLSFEEALSPDIASSATLYGLTVSQNAANGGRDIASASLAANFARGDNLSVNLSSSLSGGSSGTFGAGGRASLSYRF